ncbi:MAG: hypothetical protein LBU61_05025 [Coriobacteriales bacterium]|jgi:hypothetical protein|nr:hypothetical protein [Coriobacteriales bacterium]
MGGRGAASGVSNQGIRYGNEYVSIVIADNIKFVQRKKGASTAPLETMSAEKNRVYVTINNQNVIKTITFYDKSGKKRRQIDLTAHHGNPNPHIHEGYGHSTKIITLTKGDRAYVDKVRRIWEAVK